MGRGTKLALAASALALAFVGGAQAKPGDLDPAFDSDGKLATSFGPSYDFGNAVAIQSDGKIVAAGVSSNGANNDFALARYNTNGSLDSTFGSGGKVTTAIGSNSEAVYGLAIQSDGKIVAVGYSSNGSNFDFALVRYNTDGSLDSGFGSGGKVTTDIGSVAQGAASVALQSDGKIVVAGWITVGSSNDDFLVARYNTNGSLDSTFGTGGYTITSFGPGYDDADDVLIQPDGKVVLVGGAALDNAGSQYFFALARYGTDGLLDSTFGSGGKVTTAFGTKDDEAFGAVLQSDGKVVAGGFTKSPSAPFTTAFALARYDTGGSLDSTFGSGGKVTTALGTYDSINALALQPDGRILAAGYATLTAPYFDVAIARYTTSGALDSTFGSGGKSTNGTGTGDNLARDMALQSDGKPVTVGSLYFNSNTDADFLVERFLGNSLAVTKAGSGTGTVTSTPDGIACGSDCSSPFAAVEVTLTAAASAKSWFMGWSGDCSGTAKTCKVTVDQDRSATARFDLACIVPKVKKKKLSSARKAIVHRHCRVGKVRKAYSSKVKKGRVISQKPAAGKKLKPKTKVALKVSKGKKK